MAHETVTLVGRFRDDTDGRVSVHLMGDAVLLSITDTDGKSVAKLSREKLNWLRELLDRAAMPGQPEAGGAVSGNAH